MRAYDVAGRTTEQITYSTPGTISERRVNVYNDNGWLTGQTNYGLQSDADLVVGRNLTIPNKITNIHNDYGTFKPYNASELVGDTVVKTKGVRS